MQQKPGEWKWNSDASKRSGENSWNTFHTAKINGYALFAAGTAVGLTNLTCGMSVGIIGSSAAVVDAQQRGSLMKMFLIEIFATALGLYGVIVGIIVNSSLLNWEHKIIFNCFHQIYAWVKNI